MLITSKLFRPGGTRVELGKGKDVRRYHFKPVDRNAKLDDAEIEHVCDITNAEDIGTLLAIKEGYEVHSSEIGSKAKAAVKVAEQQHAEADKVVANQKAAALAGTQPPAPPKPYASMNKPELLKAVAERTGKQPHGSAARSKLIEQLEALDKKAG